MKYRVAPLTLQRDLVRASAGGEHRRDLLYRQRGSLRYLLQDLEAHQPYLRGPKPPGVPHYVRCDHVLEVPGAAQL